jgi:hypothetical protein
MFAPAKLFIKSIDPIPALIICKRSHCRKFYTKTLIVLKLSVGVNTMWLALDN